MLLANHGRTINQLIVILLCSILLAGCTTVPSNFQSVLANLANSYPGLWQLATATSYILGFFLVVKALYNLKIYGEARTMMSSHSSLRTPLLYFLAAAALIFLPTAFQTVNFTFFNTPNMLQYTEGPVAGFTTASIEAVIGAVQFIGLLAFIRGWLYIARAGEQSVQPGTMAKGLTHIVGGLLAINIIQTKDVLWTTFGFG